MDVRLRPMRRDDLAEVLAIERVSFPQPWRRETFEAELDNPTATLLVAECQGHITGYAGAFTVLDESNVLLIAVNPVYRRNGIGLFLLEGLLTAVRERGATRVHLEVRRSNMAAQHLYRKVGFREVGVRRNYYAAPIEDALLFSLDFTGPFHFSAE